MRWTDSPARLCCRRRENESSAAERPQRPNHSAHRWEHLSNGQASKVPGKERTAGQARHGSEMMSLVFEGPLLPVKIKIFGADFQMVKNGAQLAKHQHLGHLSNQEETKPNEIPWLLQKSPLSKMRNLQQNLCLWCNKTQISCWSVGRIDIPIQPGLRTQKIQFRWLRTCRSQDRFNPCLYLVSRTTWMLNHPSNHCRLEGFLLAHNLQ